MHPISRLVLIFIGSTQKNKLGWFPWILENCKLASGMNILETGCGDGTLWCEAKKQFSQNNCQDHTKAHDQQPDLLKTCSIMLTDISEGMFVMQDVQ